MKILLINNNPVVSRLTALSARKENIKIDEIQEVTELENDNYDIVFVDADSLSKDVKDIITEHVKSTKTVLFYGEGDDEEKDFFDITILKPFLPSEVSAVIRSIDRDETKVEEKKEESPKLLDDKKETSESSNELFTLETLDESNFELELDEKSIDKLDPIETPKKDESFDAKLEEAFPLNLDDDLFDLSSDKKEERKERFDLEEESDKKLEIELEDELFTKDDNSTIELLDFEESKKELDLLTLDSDNNSNNKEENLLLIADEEVSKEGIGSTKILDENEIENIKGLLSEDVDNELSLDSLMAAPTALAGLNSTPKLSEDKTEKKKKSKKVKTSSSKNDSNVLLETLGSLPVENLRELLAGAKVNISIKFPKAK